MWKLSAAVKKDESKAALAAKNRERTDAAALKAARERAAKAKESRALDDFGLGFIADMQDGVKSDLLAAEANPHKLFQRGQSNATVLPSVSGDGHRDSTGSDINEWDRSEARAVLAAVDTAPNKDAVIKERAAARVAQMKEDMRRRRDGEDEDEEAGGEGGDGEGSGGANAGGGGSAKVDLD